MNSSDLSIAVIVVGIAVCITAYHITRLIVTRKK